MKKLYLFTSVFPYGLTGEAFIEPELQYLLQEFNLTIVTCASENELQGVKRKLPDEVSIVHLKDRLSKVQKIQFLLCNSFQPLLWKELFYSAKSKKKLLLKWKDIVGFYIMAKNIEYQITELGLAENSDNSLFYTYWNSYQALALLFLKEKNPALKVVSRIHGYDLYKERANSGWQPFKQYMGNTLNGLFFITETAKQYFIRTYLEGQPGNRLYVCRLGVPQKEARPKKLEGSSFHLVSCSNVIPLKRVGLIVDALALCSKDICLKWTHFGDGIQMPAIKEQIQSKLLQKGNMEVSLKGYVEHQSIMHFYDKNFVDCFLSTSSSEGCPVSIQEAISYGIPIIATNVGGVSELINGNGILLKADPTAAEISSSIETMYYASAEQVKKWRQASFACWAKRFDADKNYMEFVEIIRKIENKG